MSNVNFLLSKTLLFYLWQEFWLRYKFKFILPKVTEITLDGLRLDVSSLPLKARNRLLNVGYETQEKRMCQDFLTPEDSVLEIGAAIGFIGLFCQKKLGIQNYWLFEANPRTVELLRRNYQLNGIKPAVWNLALARTDGQVELDVGTDFWENSIVRTQDSAPGRKTMEVPASTLRGLLQKVEQKVNVLIIDVEGAEQFIDWDEIPQEVNKIIIELHRELIGAEKTYNLISALIVRGFSVAREEGGTFAFIRNTRNRMAIEDLPFPQRASINGWQDGAKWHNTALNAQGSDDSPKPCLAVLNQTTH